MRITKSFRTVSKLVTMRAFVPVVRPKDLRRAFVRQDICLIEYF